MHRPHKSLKEYNMGIFKLHRRQNEIKIVVEIRYLTNFRKKRFVF